jgi:hypothetical protein
MISRTCVCSAEPDAVWNSFSIWRGLITAPVVPTDVAVGGRRTSTSALARYIGVCAVLSNPATMP